MAVVYFFWEIYTSGLLSNASGLFSYQAKL